MANSNKDTRIRVSTDFFSFKKWLLFMGGYKQSNEFSYQIYRALLVLLVTILTSLSIYGAVLVPDKKLKIDALHYSFIGIHTVYILGARYFSRKSLNRGKIIIQTGIYNYDNEDYDEEGERIRDNISVEIKRKIAFFLLPSVCGITSNQVIFPLSQLLLADEEDYKRFNEEWMNPYLPHVFYMPFNTRNPLGYCTAYLLDCLAFFSLYIVTYNMFLVYINLTTQVKMHFKLLNHSICNIQNRALNLFKKKNNVFSHRMLYHSLEFQQCLQSCLKSNIEHHQAVLRFRNEVKPYIGSVLLLGFTIAALVYACNIYLILQKPQTNVLINYILSLMADWLYAYQLCFFGEEVIDQSSQLFHTLYGISWYNYGKEFNRTLHIMMVNIMKPVKIDATLVGIAASLETYGTLLSTMYKIVSIVRQSDDRI